MRILHVYKDYYPVVGGIENHVRVLAEAQVRAGHEVTVLVTSPSRETHVSTANGVRVVRVGRLGTVASVPLAPGFPGALAREPADVSHLQVPYPVGEVAQLLRGGRRPYVVTYHADATRPVQRAALLAYAPVLRRVLDRAARVLATSEQYARSSPYLRHLADRVVVVPLGVDTQRFTPSRSRDSGRPPTVLYVGRMRHYKGVEDVLRAWPRLPGDVRLLLAGDGPMRAGWEALAERLELRGRVTFLGHVPDDALPALYRAADVFVLPATTRSEAFGSVLLEAMASGLPCVTTEVGSGTSFVVRHEETGLVVPPRSPEALARALARLVTDVEFRARAGEAGRERVLGHFRVEQMIQRVEEAYRRATGCRGGPPSTALDRPPPPRLG